MKRYTKSRIRIRKREKEGKKMRKKGKGGKKMRNKGKRNKKEDKIEKKIDTIGNSELQLRRNDGKK